MYVGGYSSETSDVISLNDPSTIPQDMSDNVFGFNVNIGTQNIVPDIYAGNGSKDPSSTNIL